MGVLAKAGWLLGAAAVVALGAPVALSVALDRDVGRSSAAGPGSVGLAPPLPSPSPTASPSPSASPRPVVAAAALSAEDVDAGLLGTTVRNRGTGKLVVVPGRVRAPGRGMVLRVKVEVERGLPVDAQRFARFVMTTLNDPRGWGAGGRLTFARTDGGDEDFRVVLASPSTNARLCRPLETKGQASCGRDGRAVLTLSRWVAATREFAHMRTLYRQYVVNHEVGHLLGHPHERCPRKGALAPIMQQQTYGLDGCRPNPWPHP
ncbi:MAG TPA: DUF3152 domain-containing protein [Kineosporiaceae bacterium]|nr:DUF3152 domain-containing protein [Kineosporiaceae bacterium]